MSRGMGLDHRGRLTGMPGYATTKGMILGSAAMVSGATAMTTAYRAITFSPAMFPADGNGARPIAVQLKSEDALTWSGGSPDNPGFPPVADDGAYVLEQTELIPVRFVPGVGFFAGHLKADGTAALEFIVYCV